MGIWKKIKNAVIGITLGAMIALPAAVIATGGKLPDWSVVPPPPETEIVYMSPGGSIYQFMEDYAKLRVSGKNLRIEGICASACTFFLGLMPPERVCASKYALFGIHGVYNASPAGMQFNPVMTKWTYEYVYPKEIRDKLEKMGWSTDKDVDTVKYPTGLIWMKGSELGVKECDG